MSNLFPRAKRVALIGLLGLVILIFLAACGSGDSAIADDVIMTLNLDDGSVYAEVSGNYMVSMDFNFTADVAGDTLYRALKLEGKRGVDPDASSYRMEPSDPAIMDGIEFMNLAALDGVSYAYSPVLGCQQFAYEEFPSPFNSLVREGGILMGEAEFKASGEIVNGVATDVYAFGLENITLDDMLSWNFSELDQGLIYVSKEDRAIVRLLFAGTGTSQFLSGDPDLVGDIYYQVDFEPTDESFDIQLPEQCSKAMTPEDITWPRMSNAQNAQIVSGMYVYMSESDLNTIVDFYYSEMAVLEFALIGDNVEEGQGAASLMFLSDTEGLVQILIQPNNVGRGFVIAIGQP